MTWHRASSDLLDPGLLGLLESLPAPLGAAALGLLSALRSWCSSHRTTEIPVAVPGSLGRLLRLTSGQLERLLWALIEAGYLAGVDGAGYQLQEAEVVTPQSSRPETGKAARMRRYRAGKKGVSEASTVDAPPSTRASTGASTRASTRETPPVSRASTGASPEASTVDAPPSQTLPPRTSTSTGTKPPSPPVGPEGSEVGAEEIPAPRPSGPPSQERYASAYAAGISRATGQPCPPPTDRIELQALGNAIRSCALDGAGKILRGPALVAWLTDSAQAYATARATESRFERGFAPSKFLDWLRAGRPAASAPVSRPARVAPTQPADPQTPGYRPRWKSAIDNESFAAEEEKASAGAAE